MTNGGYSNSGARGKDFRKLMFSKKEKELCSCLLLFSRKITVFSKKKKIFTSNRSCISHFSSRLYTKGNETVCAIFEKGAPKKEAEATASFASPNIHDYLFF